MVLKDIHSIYQLPNFRLTLSSFTLLILLITQSRISKPSLKFALAGGNRSQVFMMNDNNDFLGYDGHHPIIKYIKIHNTVFFLLQRLLVFPRQFCTR